MERFRPLIAIIATHILCNCGGLPPPPRVSNALTEADPTLELCSKEFLKDYNEIEVFFPKVKFEKEIGEVSDMVTAFSEKHAGVSCIVKKKYTLYTLNVDAQVESWNEDIASIENQVNESTDEPITD